MKYININIFSVIVLTFIINKGLNQQLSSNKQFNLSQKALKENNQFNNILSEYLGKQAEISDLNCVINLYLWFVINTSFSSLLPTFPIMYVQVHLSKHTSSCINLHQHSFSSFTLFHTILSYPSFHSIDYQLHQKDPDFPAEVHILNFF